MVFHLIYNWFLCPSCLSLYSFSRNKKSSPKNHATKFQAAEHVKHVAEQHRLPERASDAMSGVGKAQFT